MSIKNKIFGLILIFICLSGLSVAQQTGDTFIQSLDGIRQQIKQSEDNIIKDVDSFQGAFSDAFALIDAEISRLIFANAAMVGLVFAIMFLVYAKTSTRSRRDMQVLLVAHSKHLDAMVSGKLDDFTRKIEMMMEEKKTRDMSSLESLDANIKDAVVTDGIERKDRKGAVSELDVTHESKLADAKPVDRLRALVKEPEILKDKDGKVLVPKDASKPGNKFLRRMKLGILKLLGRKRHTEKVVEFKLQK